MDKEHKPGAEGSAADRQRDTSDDTEALFEIIETYLQQLSEELAGPHTPQELAEEAAALNDIIDSFEGTNELITRLLDTATPENQRDKIRRVLQWMRVEVEGRGESLARLVKRSNALINKSAALLDKVQAEIDKTAHSYSGYVLKVCGYCKGAGDERPSTCPVCLGKGNVLVKEPAVKCPRCGGGGLLAVDDLALRHTRRCAKCKGTGWVTAAQ